MAVRTAARAVTRAEVADTAGISTRLAAFHLEKLLAEGFLQASFDRVESSASAGRPAKRYHPTDLQLDVSIPPRRYDLATQILAEAFDEPAADRRQEALVAIATEYGRQIGRRTRARRGDSRLLTALRLVGYEPSMAGDDVMLRNCPFHHVAQERPDVICRMNQALVAGVLDGTQFGAHEATLSSEPGRCCVVVTSPTPPRAPRDIA